MTGPVSYISWHRILGYKTYSYVSERHITVVMVSIVIELGLCVTPHPWFPRLLPCGSTFAVTIERRLRVKSDIIPHVQYSVSVEHRVDITAACRKSWGRHVASI